MQHGGFQSSNGFSAIREEIIDKNGALFKLGTNTPSYQLKQEVYIPRSEAIEVIKRIEQEAKNRIDQYKHFTIQLKDKYNLYEQEAHTYYYQIIDDQKSKLKALIKEKQVLLLKLKLEQEDYYNSIQELNTKLGDGEKQLQVFLDQNAKSQEHIAQQQDSIYDLESKLQKLQAEYQELEQREPEKVEVEKFVFVDKPEDNTVDYDEFEALLKKRQDNKQMIKFWYQQFLRDNERAPTIEDFQGCQGLINEYLSMSKRYTELKLKLLRTDKFQANVDKFKPPEVIKEIVREEVIIREAVQALQSADEYQAQVYKKQEDPVYQREESNREIRSRLSNDPEVRQAQKMTNNFFAEEEQVEKQADPQMVALQNDIATLKKELEIKEQRNQELQDQIKRLEEMIGQNIGENKILEGLQKEIEFQKSLLLDRDHKIDGLIQQENLLNDQKKEIMQDLQKLTSTNKKLRQKNEDLNHQLELHSSRPINQTNPNMTQGDFSKYENIISPQETMRTDVNQQKSNDVAQTFLLQDLGRLRRENDDLKNQIQILEKITPGEIKYVEKRVEVPIDRIVEKIVRVEVPIEVNSQKLDSKQPASHVPSQRSDTKLLDTSLLENLKNETSMKDQEIQQLRKEITSLQALGQKEPIVQIKSDRESKEQLANVSNLVEQFKEKLAKKKQKIAQFKLQKSALDEEIVQLKQYKDQEVSRLKTEYESQIQQYELEIQNLKRDQQKLIQGGQSSIQAIQAQHDTQIQELMSKNQQEIEKREESINAYRIQLEKLQSSNNKLNDQVQNLELALEEKCKNEEKLVDKIGSLSLLAGEAAGLKAEVDQLSSELTDLKEKYHILEDKFKEEVKKRKFLHNELEDSKGQIRLYCRVRPLTKAEKEREESKQMAITINDDMNLSIQGRNGMKHFTFDSVFGPNSTQEQVFDDSKRLIQSSIDGFNVCIFAYGQTGSGKTWTIQGQPGNPGLTPRAIQELFQIVSTMNMHKIQLKCYMIELYKDELRDLLLPKNAAKRPLEIKESGSGQVVINGVTEVELQSEDDANRIFSYGIEHRMTRQTKMNEASSRSHLIYSIIIDATNTQTRIRTVGKLSFVDLAGSESSKKTGTDKEGQAEAKAINMSLSALGNVIEALSKGSQHVPYRDHTLTKVMKDSLGGTAKTLMFVNVSPSMYNQSESINSMDYATRVKKIKNQVKINIESKETSNLKKLVQTLEQAMDQYKELLLKSNMAGEYEKVAQMFVGMLGQDLETGPSVELQELQDDKDPDE
eukprot:403337633